MMKTGLYKACYKGSLGTGYGLAFLGDGKIYGGDAMIYYTGTYTEFENGTVQAKVKGAAYRDGEPLGLESLFARDKNTIELNGDLHSDGRITLEARSKQMPGIALQIELTFLSE